jgi:RNA polymerase sigma factor (sigma-70 family)
MAREIFYFFERFALAGRVLVWIVIMKLEPSELATRWTLIRKLNKAECDEESWKDFYNLYRKLIYGVARKSGLRHEEAEDAVAETMRSVCENIRDFVPDAAHGSFKSWLLQTARWRITDQLRKRSGQSSVSVATPDDTRRTSTVERVPDPASLNLDAVWEAEWQKELFETAVSRIKDQVSPDQYQIFDFYVLRQMPVAKVARSLGVNVAQIYLARHRVLKAIKKEVRNLERKLG